MPVTSELTAGLRQVVLALEDDLRERVESQDEVLGVWRADHGAARERERTASSWQEWRDDRVTQVAVAWVLTCVFVRFCEDNELLVPVWFAGPAHRRREAVDAELAFVRAHPESTDREWIGQAIEHLASVPATKDLVGEHSPLWLVSPSGQAARELVAAFRARTDDDELVWDFADPDRSTRFLGDLYQDLSEHAKKTFALLQTPVFVEELILDQSLEPALAQRPLEGFRLIDPTCGSGHFLLGAFARLGERWARQAPGLNSWQRVQHALDGVHGVDLNPFAVAIARFRLIVAALQACGLGSLEDAPGFAVHVAAGDSLLHGRRFATERFEVFDDDADLGGFTYATEDKEKLREILTPGRYDVVVGNPPYVTVKDKALNARYRQLYSTCKGTYALTVPFMERFLELAKPAEGDRPAGWVGQITSNSFMKREFGSTLIEDFLAKQDLRLVIDTSGAYIPGHGTPTVILIARPQRPVGDSVRAVLGVRGEPGQPADPAHGLVWRQIVDNLNNAGFDGDYVSVVDLPRDTLKTHPWSLTGGGANDLHAMIDGTAEAVLADHVRRIGFMAMSHADQAFTLPADFPNRHPHVRGASYRPLVVGEDVRDFSCTSPSITWFPYDGSRDLIADEGLAAQQLWPLRTGLGHRATFTGTYFSDGISWWAWHQVPKDLGTSPLSIAFAFVATHNHFVLDRGGKVFKQSAPVIKLPAEASEEDHLALLGVLNSSTACFWLKQNSHRKASAGMGGGMIDQPWSWNYEFTGTTLKGFPLPAVLPVERGRILDSLARELAAASPAALVAEQTPTSDALDAARTAYDTVRARMVAVQEELDWECYRLYGILDEDVTYPGEPPPIALGERAFEIALARRVAAGQERTAWFERHGSTPVTDIPAHWPADYQALVQARLNLLASHKHLRLLEKPEHKRRWATTPWVRQVDAALRSWLLDRLEDRSYWFDAQGRPVARSIGQLADVAARDGELVAVLQLWSRRRDASVADLLTALLTDEAVPYLAAYRLKDSGMRKRQAWEHTWALQRREDTGTLDDAERPIPVPPKYTSADFRKASWWQHRGKLDVPKERFILYPDAGRATDPSLVLGWAGWDHLHQFLALAALVQARTDEGWTGERLLPLLAGLAELTPWVRQWHDHVDTTFGVNMADYAEEILRDELTRAGLTAEQAAAWRPAASTRGRKPRSVAAR